MTPGQVMDRLDAAQVSSATRALARRTAAAFLPGEVLALFWDTENDTVELLVRLVYPDGKTEGSVTISG